MHYCPHCNRPSAASRGPCPHCGKELSGEQPQESAASGEAEPEAARRYVDPATGEVVSGGGPPGTSDIDLGAGSDEPLELGFDPSVERAKKASPPPSVVAASGIDAGEDSASSSPAAGPVFDEPDRAAEIAGFGEPPDSIFKAPSYMFRVRSRRSELTREIASIEKKLEDARKVLDTDLLDVGNAKLEQCPETGEYEQEVQAIGKSREELSSFREDRKQEEHDIESQASYMDEEIARLRVEAKKFEGEEEILAREAEDAHASRKRVQLKIQRVDIEIRNARARMPTAKKGEPPPDPSEIEAVESRIDALKRDRQEIQPELDAAEEEVKNANRKLALARNAASEQRGKVELAEKKRDDLLKSHAQRSQKLEGRFFELQKQQDDRIRTLARKALADGVLPPGKESMAEELSRKIAVADAVQAELDLHRQAMDAYHKGTYQKGIIVLGAGAGLVLVVLVVILAIIF